MFLIIGLGIKDADDMARAVSCKTFDRAVEIVKCAGIGIAAEFLRRIKVAVIADPRGYAQGIDSTAESFLLFQ